MERKIPFVGIAERIHDNIFLDHANWPLRKLCHALCYSIFNRCSKHNKQRVESFPVKNKYKIPILTIKNKNIYLLKINELTVTLLTIIAARN